MKLLTFKGGTHPADHKAETMDLAIEDFTPSKTMVYPMSQHIGAPCTPIVKVGDRVLLGQKIGDSDAFVSSPVHSTVSGKVIAIEKRPHPNGTNVLSIVIENDFEDEAVPEIKDYDDYDNIGKEEMLKRVKEAGIVGLGGATFPTFIKLNPPPEKKIDCCIVNAAECEPYLTSDYRVMLETPDLALEGLRLTMKILGVTKGYIGIENNKPEAIKIMTEHAKKYEGITVCALKTKYPQGSEKHLIKAITGREVPSGMLPADVGVVVDNIDTYTAICNAIKKKKPIMTRIVTVSGTGVNRKANFRVRLGTSFADIMSAAELDTEKTKKIIAGGPMMGTTQKDLSACAIKGTSALLAFTDEELDFSKESPCLRCGNCVTNCPMGLVPAQLNAYAKVGDAETCAKYDAMDCIECGVCSYNCPCGNHITQRIKLIKRQIAASRKKN